MSNSNSNQEGTSAYLINPYGKPMSRLVRTKDTNQESSVLTKPTQSVITQPSLLVRKGRNQQTANQTQKLMPSRVSDLSSNVVFQDVDSPTKSISRTSAKQQEGNKDKEVKPNMIGLIGNAFMGATTKYTKVPFEQITTPTKNILSQQINTPKNSETQSNTHTKFARRREVQPQKVEKQNELTLDFNSVKTEAREEVWTDRSANQSNRKIQRKTDRNRRQLKFGQKRQTKETEIQTLSQLGEQSRVLERNNKPTQVSKQIKNQTQPIETPVVKPKPYQPIRRSNAETVQVEAVNNITQGRPASNYRINRVEQSTQLAQQEKSVPQPREQVIKKQSVKSQPTLSNSLKKSVLVGYTIKRLLFSQLASSFSQLKFINSQSKIKTNKQSWLLGQAAFSISRNKETGFLRWSFDLLKYKFSQKYVTQLKNELLYKQPNRTQIAFSLLQKIYQSKLQSVLRRLKHRHFWSKQQIQSFNILDRIHKKKIVQLQQLGWVALVVMSKTKVYLLTNLNKIVSNFNKYKLGLAFIKLQAAAKPKIEKSTPKKKINISLIKEPSTSKEQQQSNTPIKTNQALIQKAQKLKAIVNSVKDNLTIINKKLKEAEQQSTQQKQELEQKVVSLKQTNQEIESQLQSKKGRISVIQKQLSTINSKVEPKTIEDELEINTQDLNLQKLVKVYMGNYKNKQELITSTEILEEFQLSTDNGSKTSLEWQLLADNIQLKQLIAAYEQHVGSVEFKARKMALAQQQVAAKLVRSYIKEQYFWQWLHLTAQSMECK